MFKFISLVLVIVFMMAWRNVYLLAVEANDAEMHYFHGMEYYMYKQRDVTMKFYRAIELEPNHAKAQSNFKIASAKLERDNSTANTTPFVKPVSYGCLGCLGGCLIGGSLGGYADHLIKKVNTQADDDLFAFYCFSTCSMLGAGIGTYVGSKDIDSTWERSVYIGGAIIATGLVYHFLVRLYFEAMPLDG